MDQNISNYTLQCDFDLEQSSKKVIQYFKLTPESTLRDFRIKTLRPMTEAKVSA
ncbi:MAG: hypothetical protein WCL02_06375 [bacterium]